MAFWITMSGGDFTGTALACGCKGGKDGVDFNGMPGAEAFSKGDFAATGGNVCFGASLTGGALAPGATGDSNVGVVDGEILTLVTPGGALTGVLVGVLKWEGGDFDGMPGTEACST